MKMSHFCFAACLAALLVGSLTLAGCEQGGSASTEGTTPSTGTADSDSEDADSEKAESDEAKDGDAKEDAEAEANADEAKAADAKPSEELKAADAGDAVAKAPDVEPKAASKEGSAAAIDKSANGQIKPGDCPMWGLTSYRNNVPIPSHPELIPTRWDIGGFDRKTGAWLKDRAENIKWAAAVGSQTYGNPVIAGGKVYVGTNNGGGHLKRYPADVDLGCMLCFSEKDGSLLWQHSNEKLPTGRVHDWPLQGVCCAPYAEGDRMWFVSNRGNVVCCDAEGFHDGKDDGEKAGWGRLFDEMKVSEDEIKEAIADNKEPPVDHVGPAVAALKEGKLNDWLRTILAERGMPLAEGDVAVKAGEKPNTWEFTAKVDGADRQFRVQQGGPRLSAFKLITPDDKTEADVIWAFDMMKAPLGVSQHNMCACSITALGDILFVNTSNGLDESHINLPAPNAPSFIAMNKDTGEIYWTDKSPGTNILHGQWSSPTVGVIQGEPQVIFGGGDGWVYAFKADKGQKAEGEQFGHPTLLWKFDANPKDSKWELGGRGTRNNIIATPVIYDGLVYVAVGQDPEHGEGDGHLWCIDPTKRGDVSPELAMKLEGNKRVPIPHKRIQAVIAEEGEIAVPNPDSAAVWHYSQFDLNGNGKIDFEETMHRSCGTVAIKDDLLFISDFSGLFHCLNAKTGKPYWTYDMLAAAWGSPLIVNDHVYIGDEDGDVCVFKLSPEKQEPLEEISMDNSVYSTPVIANDTLFIANRTYVFAIQKQGVGE